MKQCEWCGLISENDSVCSWCKKVFPGAELPHGVEPTNRPAWPFIAAGVLFVVLVGVVASSQTRAASAETIKATPVVYSSTPSKRSIPRAKTASAADRPSKSSIVSFADTGSQPDLRVIEPATTVLPPVPEETPSIDEPEAIVPSPAMQLVSANLGYRQDEQGAQMAAGTVVVVNDGNVAISDFTINLRIDGVTHRLMPFNGNLANPRDLDDIVIQPGERISIPVITDRPFTAPEEAMKTVTVRARGESGGTLTEAVDVP